MIAKETYAQLALWAYKRTPENQASNPSGWTELQRIGNDDVNGFSAAVFKNGNEIVISFAGTNESMLYDFAVANIPAGLGLPSAQVFAPLSPIMRMANETGQER
jgi:hypothetical protein